MKGEMLPVRMIAWEITRQCPYNCTHCRADALSSDYSDELSTDECFRFIDSIAASTQATLLFTGGEPLSRTDIFQCASCATDRGIRVVMASCGALIDEVTAQRIKQSGILRVSLSLDGIDAATHDAFRGVPGAYDQLMQAIALLKAHDIPFQINTTLSKHNIHQIEDIYHFALACGAVAFHPFFLVPVGRGRHLAGMELSKDEYETSLAFFCREMIHTDNEIRITCAPQFTRTLRTIPELQNSTRRDMLLSQRGCLAGDSFIFVSHTGMIQPCGFLDIACSSLRDCNFDLYRAYTESGVLQTLRNRETYSGACGNCSYLMQCGGCRARAYERYGDYTAPDPHCL